MEVFNERIKGQQVMQGPGIDGNAVWRDGYSAPGLWSTGSRSDLV